MSLSPVRALLAPAVALLLTAGTLSPAAAEVVRRTDAAGDAPAAIDVTRARYAHDSHVRVKVAVPDLGRRGAASLAVSRFTVFEAGYVATISKPRGRPARLRLEFFDHFDLEPRSCPGLAGRWGRTRVTLAVPRSCLEGHRTPHVFAQVSLTRDDALDRVPPVRRLRRS